MLPIRMSGRPTHQIPIRITCRDPSESMRIARQEPKDETCTDKSREEALSQLGARKTQRTNH